MNYIFLVAEARSNLPSGLRALRLPSSTDDSADVIGPRLHLNTVWGQGCVPLLGSISY
jgi:hypothetical protein